MLQRSRCWCLWFTWLQMFALTCGCNYAGAALAQPRFSGRGGTITRRENSNSRLPLRSFTPPAGPSIFCGITQPDSWWAHERRGGGVRTKNRTSCGPRPRALRPKAGKQKMILLLGRTSDDVTERLTKAQKFGNFLKKKLLSDLPHPRIHTHTQPLRHNTPLTHLRPENTPHFVNRCVVLRVKMTHCHL